MEKPLLIASLALSGGDNVVKATRFRILEGGSQSRKHGLLTLVTTLNLSEGDHFLDTMHIVLSDGSEGVWNIGNWRIAVIPPPMPEAPVRVGKRTLSAGTLDYYSLELTNTSDAPVLVKDLILGLPGIKVSRIVLEGEEEGSDEDLALSLTPGQTKIFEFWFHRPGKEAPGPREFFVIKPILVVLAGEIEASVILPAAMYFPPVTDELLQFVTDTGGRYEPGG